MVEIQALTYNDLPPVLPISGTITGSGTIGRGDDNAVVLPDPMNVLSRRHLQVSLQTDGLYRIDNISSGNPVFVNGEELKRGTGRALQDRDRIALGGYVLQARYISQGPAHAPAPAAAAASDIPDDDFVAALLGPDAGKRAAPAPTEPMPSLEGDDPLAALMSGAAGGERRDPMQTLNERGLELGSLDGKGDELINSGDARDLARDLVRDPLSGPTPDRQLAHGDASLDPLAMFGGDDGGGGAFDDILGAGKNPGAAPTRMNVAHGPELAGLFRLPDPIGPPPSEEPLPAPPPLPDGGEAPPQTSGDAGGIDILGNIDDLIAGLASSHATQEEPPPPSAPDAFLPPEDGHATAAAPPSSAPQPAEPARAPAIDSAPPLPLPPDAAEVVTGQVPDAVDPAPVSHRKPVPDKAAPPPAASADMAELYGAFIEGLGVELPGRSTLDKAFMKTLGQMMRGYAQGAVDLIAGRAIVKQAVRANVTLIAPERNNPLKFSSDGNAALLYLLGKPFPGFMGPVEAIQNAFTDLRAHQVGVVSGMHSALNHVLHCFDPATIGGGESAAPGLLEQALPSRRKARLWDAYERYFETMRENVADRFQDFFGAAFVKAYEDAISALQSGERAGRP